MKLKSADVYPSFTFYWGFINPQSLYFIRNWEFVTPNPKYFSTLFFLVLFSLSLNAQGEEDKLFSVLGDKKQEIFPDSIKAFTWLEQTLAIFKDEAGDTSFDEVLKNDQWFGENNSRKDFDPQAVYWMKVNLRPGVAFQDTCQFNIENDQAFRTWEQIDAYLVHEDGRIEQQQTGSGLAVQEKSIPSLGSVVAFGLDKEENASLYIRVEGSHPHRTPSFLGMYARRTDRLSPLMLAEGYQFSGTFKTEHDYSPFRYNIVPNIELLEAPNTNSSLDDILAEQEDANWEDNYYNIVPEKGKVYWLKTQLKGNPAFFGEHIFYVSRSGTENQSFDYVDAYVLKNGDLLSHQRTGNAVPTRERPYDFWASFFKVELQPTDTIDIYVRLEGLHRVYPMRNIHLLHIDPTSLFPRQVNEARKSMFILGGIAIQFIFFIFLFFIERERIHFYFAGFILGIFLVLSAKFFNFRSFVPFPEFIPNFEMLTNIGVLVNSVCLLKFIEIYFNISPKSFTSRWLIPGFIVLQCFRFLFRVFENNLYLKHLPFYELESMAKSISLVFVIWIGLTAKKQSPLLKIIFFIGFLPPIITQLTAHLLGLAYYFRIINSPITIHAEDYYPLFMLFLLMVLSLSIGYRKNLLKKEKDKAIEANDKAQQTIIEKLEETARLEKRDEVKTRFFTNISHEFRTPLTVILGMADQLKEARNQNKLTNGIDLIERNGKKLLQLTNQLLDLSKIDAANLEVNYQNKEVVAFVQYVGESFESLAEKKGVRLSIYSEIDELIMAIDPIKLQKIIANLLSNAIKFTPARGKVVLHLSQKETQLQLKVKDTGAGIAETALPYIFDRFYQVDTASSRQGDGTGIGLALVKELVNLLDGKIKVKSELGRGTEFLVTLPIMTTNAAETEEPLTEQAELIPVITPSSLIRTSPVVPVEELLPVQLPQLLIVEDNPDVVYYIQSVLEGHYHIQIATDGQVGIDMAIESIPDIIISDVMMPEKDGFELVETLKTDERTSHIPIILLTAKATQGDKVTGLRHGADAYLMKPFDKEELQVRLQKLLENRQLLQRKYSSQLSTDAASPVKTPEDRFMAKIQELLNEHFEDTELSVKDIAKMLHLSHQQFYRKFKALTNQTPVRYLRSFRLQKAKALLESSAGLNVSEVAYDVGFDNPNYFSRVFTEEFGVTPNQVRR